MRKKLPITFITRESTEDMEDLINSMKTVLASSFAFYLKAHGFHWNVEGINFPQLHKFFLDVYEQAHDEVDDVAERIRALNAYAPASLVRFHQLSKVSDQINIPTPINMIRELESDNLTMIAELKHAYALAEKVGEVGISNYLQGRIEARNKLGWMLRSTGKVVNQ